MRNAAESANVVSIRPRVTLGGSTAAAACGIDPYRSRIALWAELTGRMERDESEAMKWGRLLQPVIMGELREQGYAVSACDPSEEWRDPARPWLVGHPDGYLWDDVTADGVLEVKTANAWAKWTDRVPIAYEAQVQIYLHLTGLDRGLVACLVGGQRLEVRDVERSDSAIGFMLALMDEFMGYVTRDEPPPPDASESSRDALLAMYPEHAADRAVRLTREQMATVAELRSRRAQLAAIKEQTDGLENQLRAWMGDAELAISPHDEQVATWRTYTERRMDAARLKRERPEVAAEFTEENRRRRFTLD